MENFVLEEQLIEVICVQNLQEAFFHFFSSTIILTHFGFSVSFIILLLFSVLVNTLSVSLMCSGALQYDKVIGNVQFLCRVVLSDILGA